MFQNLKNLQPEVYKLIFNSYQKNRLVHTYLFVGEQGTLKEEASKFFASLLLCENEGACGKCEQCQSIMEDNNPNLFYIYPDGQTIKKNQIVDLEHEFSLKSNQTRIFIIKDIDKATLSSANSLLKFIEEVNENCYGILITENIDNVLPTIKSRCQVIHFKPFKREIVYENLVANKINKDLASAISLITTNLDEATKLTNDEVMINMVGLAKKMMMNLENNNLALSIMSSEGKLLFRESKEYHEYFFDILIAMQNDKIKTLVNDNNLVFKSFIKQIPIHYDINIEIKILEIMMELKKKIRYNLNMELAYLQMLIEIGRCCNG